MPLTALMLVLAAALLHALWNIAAKRAGGDHRFAFLTVLVSVTVWAPAAWVFGADEVPRWTALQWAAVTASAALHVVYFLTLLRGYREADLTVVYPVARGTGPLITVLVAVPLLGERPGWLGALGVAAVCGGVFVLAGGPRLLRAHGDARLHAGLRWGALTGLFIAGYSVLDGYAVKVMLISPILLDWLTNVLRLPFLLPGHWRDWRRDRAALQQTWRTQWRYALVGALLAPVGYVMVLYALTMAPMSLVSPAREVSMLFAALIGGRLLGEGERWLRLAGAVCIAGGVALLASA